MEFRVKERVGAIIGWLLVSTALFGQSFQYKVWHGHSRVFTMPPRFRKAGVFGVLTIDDKGVSFAPKNKPGKKPGVLSWTYSDIHQLKISPESVSLLTYKDNGWKLGADRQYDFELVSEDKKLEDAYAVLKTRLDQRFVAVLADNPTKPLWEIPVKHLSGFSGDQGVLQVGRDEIVYKSDNEERTRTWRYEDIDNISSSGPFQLTITTFERAKLSYGSRKAFNFQLKEPLAEERYNDLWLRLNHGKGLEILGSYRAGDGGR